MRALDYALKRIALAAITLFVVVSMNFALFRVLPGDAVTKLGRDARLSAAAQQDLRRQFGLDKSVPGQYVAYLGQLAQGNLGISYQSRRAVRDELWDDLKNTVPLVALATLLAVVLGVATGVVAAWRRGTLLEKASVWTGLAFFSLPTQWLAIMLILYLAGPLGLPTHGISDPYLSFSNPGLWGELTDRLSHMVLPSLTLALVLYGEYTLIARSALLETFGEDYVLTARAKGLTTWQVVRRHALRNSLLPITTLVFLSLGFIAAGSILIEAVFSYPGIGLLAYQSVFQKDYPMLQGAFLLITASIVVANLIADLLYVKLDPRIVE